MNVAWAPRPCSSPRQRQNGRAAAAANAWARRPCHESEPEYLAQDDAVVCDLDAFLREQRLLLREPASESGQRAGAADDTMTRDGRRVRVLVQRVADGAVRLAPERAGDLAVGRDLAFGHPGAQGPDLLVERHAGEDFAGFNLGFHRGSGGMTNDQAAM